MVARESHKLSDKVQFLDPPPIPCSSAVESSAVNRFVASSNLAGGVALFEHLWGHSSIGRALDLHSRGFEFETR